MTTAYTSLLGLALPVTGELSGTWGTTVNDAITSLLDSAVAGTTTLSSDADVTLTTTNGAANTSREAILLWTAGGTVTRNITAPAQSKTYIVINKSSSTQSIVLRGVGPTTGVTIVQGESAVCAWNGSDFIKVSNISGAGSFTSLTYTTTLTGGTGIVNLGSGQFYKDASGNVGIGTSSPGEFLHLNKASGDLAQRFQTSGGNCYVANRAATSAMDLLNAMNGPITLATNNIERMRIDSSGNVGIGATTNNVYDQVGTSRPLVVQKSDSSTTLNGSTAAIAIVNSDTTTSNTAQLNFAAITGASTNQYSSAIIACTFGARTNGQYPTGILTFSTSPILNAAPTEKMRIDSSGIVLVGATSARTTEAKIELTSAANTALSFYMYKTSQVEVAMGFKSSTDSNFYVGAGSASVGTYGVYLTNTGSSWNAVSDERMKTIVEPIQNASAKVATLRAVMGYYNNDKSQTRRPFLIAQDVQAVLPEAVNVQDVETGTLGMSYTDTIPLLVAAINELKAEFDAYKAAHP